MRVKQSRKFVIFACALGLAIPVMASCTQWSEADTMNTDGLLICPSRLSSDVATYLGVEAGQQISITELRKSANKRGFNISSDAYIPFSPECSENQVLQGRPVTKVTIGWDDEKEIFRSFVIVANDEGFVSHIEARYSLRDPTF